MQDVFSLTYPVSIQAYGQRFVSVAHAYLAAPFESEPTVQKRISEFKDYSEAMTFVGKLKLPADWPRRREDQLYDLLRRKFIQPNLAIHLLRSTEESFVKLAPVIQNAHIRLKQDMLVRYERFNQRKLELEGLLIALLKLDMASIEDVLLDAQPNYVTERLPKQELSRLQELIFITNETRILGKEYFEERKKRAL